MSVEVRTSQIHGRGVFAVRDFAKGDPVVKWNNTRELSKDEFESLPEAEHHYIDIQDGKILLVGEPERYVNHSCNPNTVSGGKVDIAARDIKKGEEITADYGSFYVPDSRFFCACGSANCRGLITGKKPDIKSVPSTRPGGPA